MDGTDVAEFLATLPGCKRKGTAEVPAWYVDDRIVARLVSADELMIRCAFEQRERLVAERPDTFAIPRAYAAHQRVQARLDGDEVAILGALQDAWDMQRK